MSIHTHTGGAKKKQHQRGTTSDIELRRQQKTYRLSAEKGYFSFRSNVHFFAAQTSVFPAHLSSQPAQMSLAAPLAKNRADPYQAALTRAA